MHVLVVGQEERIWSDPIISIKKYCFSDFELDI